MEKRFIFSQILLVLVISSGVSYGLAFRPDYTLDAKAGGWLKFHRIPLRWDQAHLTCMNEGAILASPSNYHITKALSRMMVEHGITTTPIFTGISKKISNSVQKSIEGVPISNTFSQTLENCIGMNVNGTIGEVSCLDYHPFACFMKIETGKVTECGTSDQEFVLDNRTGSCYKVHQEKHTWSDAATICTAEGAHLVVINSEDEANVIWELAKDSTTDVGATVIIGFRSDSEKNYGNRRTGITVQGESLEEAGYSRWSRYGDPNNTNKNCGTAVYDVYSKEDGILGVITCSYKLMFICEIETNSTMLTSPPRYF